MSLDKKPILVATCGNRHAGDDAFGPMLADLLRQHSIPDVEVVDLAMSPCSLVDVLGDCEALIIADAALCPAMPAGTLLEYDWYSPDRPPLAHEEATSTHGMSIDGQVQLAHSLGLLPPVIRIIAVNIGQIAPGTSAGDAVTNQLEPARQRIAALAQEIHYCPLTEMWYG